MELIAINNNIIPSFISDQEKISKGNFIEANTKQVTLDHIKNNCIIPVYSDNESTISHAQFIDAAKEVVQSNFQGETILEPNIRVSHIIKGRIPSAIGKPIRELKQEEKTIYYQRVAFFLEIPTLKEYVNDSLLSLTIGGIRALNQENLYSKRNLEKFKVFIGFKNKVCTNLCISTDGLKTDLRVGTIEELKDKIHELIHSFDKERFLGNMERMSKFQLNESEFAHLVGKMRMYSHLDKNEKNDKQKLAISDHQIGTVVKNYFEDENFSKGINGVINLWQIYNLMTDANKSSYIDSNFERNVNAFEFINGLATSIQNKSNNWFLQSQDQASNE